MQFLTSLFGGTENTLLNAAFALGIVLVLVLLGLWVMKFFMQASSSMSRGRNRRLMVVESLQLDARHKVTILRRDNVEHVIMIGGAQDVVIETGIAVEKIGIRRPPQPPASKAAPTEISEPAPPATGRTAMDRLRDTGRTAPARKPPSLRNTGLLRTIGRPERPVIPINGYNSDPAATDSATSGSATETNGQAKLGAASTRSYSADVLKSEGK